MKHPDIYVSDTTLTFDDTLRADLVFTDGPDTGIVGEELLRLESTDDGIRLVITSGTNHVIVPWRYAMMFATGTLQMIDEHAKGARRGTETQP
jgi:hypothetical protein